MDIHFFHSPIFFLNMIMIVVILPFAPFRGWEQESSHWCWQEPRDLGRKAYMLFLGTWRRPKVETHIRGSSSRQQAILNANCGFFLARIVMISGCS